MLVVNNFKFWYVFEEYALHIKQTLLHYYSVTTEWEGKQYIRITLDRDYKQRQVHLSMSGYVKDALKQLQHTMNKEQQQPFSSAPIRYGAKQQYATQESTSPPLNKKDKKFIQHVCDKFPFVGQAIDITLLYPINATA